MFRVLERRLDQLLGIADAAVLRGGLRGVEKESLRVTRDGRVSPLPHTPALGSPLTHPWITTDFSEALMELVTPPLQTSWETLGFLCDLHWHVYDRIGDEMLWATSMPCAVEGEHSIPIAVYGDSNPGRMKHIYRRGLSHRYGRLMQAIAGVHFNYSAPDHLWPVLQEISAHQGPVRQYRDEAYFGLLRNYRRLGWLVLYLFGASPALCKSFFCGRSVDLPDWDDLTFYGPHATTLRMSDIGYSNSNQASICLSMNALDEYIEGLDRAIRTPHPAYEAIGTVVDGEWRQLSTSILQIENEYYSFIRPKHVARSGERPTHSLQRGGVQYVEVRALDVSPFDPAGISQNEIRFLEAFLLLCLLADSPAMNGDEAAQCDANHLAVALKGRDPALELRDGETRRPLREWGGDVLAAMAPICDLLDGEGADGSYTAALERQREKIADAEQTPSAKILREMRDENEPFYQFGLRLSAGHRDYFAELSAPDPERRRDFDAQVQASLERQSELESSPAPPFEEFLRSYFGAA